MTIKIEERQTEKVPGETSLFVSFPYNQELIDIIKSFSGSNYSKKTKVWEIPVPYLHKLIDEACLIGDIELLLLEDDTKQDVDYNSIQLQEYRYKPFAYQEEGIKYGLTHDSWLLLFDMGLGKSNIIICIANELKQRGEIEHCLIICGVNSLKSNWKKEIKKFTDLSCTVLGERYTRTGRAVTGTIADRLAHLKRPIEEFFVITNIETLRNPEIVKAINDGPNKFDMIAVDEIHRCSSDPSTKQAIGLLGTSGAKYKIGATGTLITNDPLNSYVPLKWIGAERGTYTNFKNFYCVFSNRIRGLITGVKNMDYLRDIIKDNSLRKTKDILGLPPKTIINEYVDMEEAQEHFYEDIKHGIKDQVDKIELNTTNLLALVARLRQATACPTYLTTENIPSAKVDRAVDLVEQIVSEGNKVVVFSTFKETVNILNERLEKYRPLVCTGDVKDADVSDNIDTFQKDDSRKVFLATWQKCGTGVTLTASRYMIFLDIPYTNASYEQAQDRIYRIGTDSPVFIYHLITTGTVDERVLEIVEDKAAISDYLVDGQVPRNVMNSLRSIITEL